MNTIIAGQTINVIKPVAKPPVRLLICDDSIFMRMAIRTICEDHPQITIIGEAKNGAEVIEAVRTLAPDVITMDVDMPGIDGIAATETISAEYDVPIIILSALTEKRSALAQHTLDAGAVDVIWKSASLMDIDIGGIADTIVEKILLWGTRPHQEQSLPENEVVEREEHDIILIALGTGGPHAVGSCLGILPPDTPPIIVAANIPSACMEGFMRYLQRVTGQKTSEAEEGQFLQGNCIYVISSEMRLGVQKTDTGLCFNREPPQASTENWASSWRLQASIAATAEKPMVLLLSGALTDPRAVKTMSSRAVKVVVQNRLSCVDTAGGEIALTHMPSAIELTPASIQKMLGVS